MKLERDYELPGIPSDRSLRLRTKYWVRHWHEVSSEAIYIGATQDLNARPRAHRPSDWPYMRTLYRTTSKANATYVERELLKYGRRFYKRLDTDKVWNRTGPGGGEGLIDGAPWYWAYVLVD